MFGRIKLYLTAVSVNVKWAVVSHIPKWNGCASTDNALIISLTTYPARIKDAVYAIKSLLMQTLKPSKIILWLACEQFPNKEYDLPKKLLNLKKFGLKIEWCTDIRSFKKLVPSLKKYPDSFIFTADDDVYYNKRVLENAWETHKKYPNMIISHRITKFYLENDTYCDISGGFETYAVPSLLHKLTGVGGVLYPPHSLHKDVLDENLFMELCPTNDDIWFWLMGVRIGTKVAVPEHNFIDLRYVGKTQQNGSLSALNDYGENLFWKHFYNILRKFPEIDTALRKEFVELS